VAAEAEVSWRRRLRPLVPARYRSQAIVDRWVERATGATVVAGPFAGMKYVVDPAALVLPKLLGSYERELAGVVQECIGAAYPLVVNAGAAEGCYAIGLARANHRTRVIAFETDRRRRELLAEIAALNGVHERIEIAGACDRLALGRALGEVDRRRPGAGEGRFDRLALDRAVGQANGSLLLMDIEGGESELLDPQAVPAEAMVNVMQERRPERMRWFYMKPTRSRT